MTGQNIARYRVTTELGRGGLGEVYQATGTKLDREVAVKVVPESFAQDRERVGRFDRVMGHRLPREERRSTSDRT